jgi:ketosteroid isomerase-like protein
MKNLSNFSLYLIAFSLLLTIGCQQQHDMEKLQSQVDAINDEMVEAIMANNPDASLKLYAEDLVSLPSYQPMIKGMEAMKAQIEEQKEMPMNMQSFTLTTMDLWASGKFVIEIGTYDMGMEWPDAPGGIWKDKGKYVTIFEIQENGSLLIKADIWNTDTNPWEEMMAAQEEQKK